MWYPGQENPEMTESSHAPCISFTWYNQASSKDYSLSDIGFTKIKSTIGARIQLLGHLTYMKLPCVWYYSSTISSPQIPLVVIPGADPRVNPKHHWEWSQNKTNTPCFQPRDTASHILESQYYEPYEQFDFLSSQHNTFLSLRTQTWQFVSTLSGIKMLKLSYGYQGFN